MHLKTLTPCILYFSDYAEKSCVYEYPTSSTFTPSSYSSHQRLHSTIPSSRRSDERWSIITQIVSIFGVVILAMVLAVLYRKKYCSKNTTQKRTAIEGNIAAVCTTKSQEETACCCDENGNMLLNGKLSDMLC